MSYIELDIKTAEEGQELLIGALADLKATGFEQTTEQLIAYFNEAEYPEAEVEEILNSYDYQIKRVGEQNWNELWESNFDPVQLDRFCAIRADFHQPIAGAKHEIVITPKMSFGTGHHATTYMMVKQMEGIDFSNRNVFDFGTGTGILSILAEKLGALHIDAIDVDHWSIENAQENIVKNHCRSIALELSSQIPEKKYDIVLANINKNVILHYLGDLYRVLNQNGNLLLSGLLLQDKEDIIKECEAQQLILTREMEKQNWVSLLFNRL